MKVAAAGDEKRPFAALAFLKLAQLSPIPISIKSIHFCTLELDRTLIDQSEVALRAGLLYSKKARFLGSACSNHAGDVRFVFFFCTFLLRCRGAVSGKWLEILTRVIWASMG